MEQGKKRNLIPGGQKEWGKGPYLIQGVGKD